MSTLYEILEINNDATALQIKKGYFAMVRKYPPERFPEKFMEVRNAYETLSNETTRKEYNLLFDMPIFIRQYFERAQRFMEEGEFSNAVSILEELSSKCPDILTVQNLLGEAYFKNGNTGKAINVFEELVRREPDNAGFAGHLANVYLERGWQKKAISAYKKAIELDKDNISLWAGLSDSYLKNEEYEESRQVLNKALELGGNEERGILLTIYLKLSILDILDGDFAGLKLHLGKMSDIAVNEEDMREHIGWLLYTVSMQLIDNGLYQEANELLDNACKLNPGNQQITSLKNDFNIFFDIADEYQAFEEDDEFSDELKEFVWFKLMPGADASESTETTKAYHIMAEFDLLQSMGTQKKQIITFRKSYPKMYSLLSDFLDDILIPGKYQKLLESYEKKIYKNRKTLKNILSQFLFDDDDDEYDDESDYSDDLFTYDEPQQPFKREEPKVGRNDPCPCGSGKKYKKCCGK